MKPPPLAYDAPTDIDQALALLTEHGEEAKVLAGGQSLIPLLNFRLAAPARLIDINGLGALTYLTYSNGTLHIGALTRQAMLERSSVAAAHWPILQEALAVLAHPQIRNRGTVGGSAVHADPAAELPVVFAALDARFHIRSTRGARTLAWHNFFLSMFTSALEPDELLTEVEVPAVPARTGMAFTEFARRHGDFALGGAAALVTLNPDGSCTRAAICLLGAGPVPVRPAAAEAALVGHAHDERILAEAARLAVDGANPPGDVHGSSTYRRRVIEALVRRAVTRAWQRARQSGRSEII